MLNCSCAQKMQLRAQLDSFPVFINLCMEKAEQLRAKEFLWVLGFFYFVLCFVMIFVLNFETPI